LRYNLDSRIAIYSAADYVSCEKRRQFRRLGEAISKLFNLPDIHVPAAFNRPASEPAAVVEIGRRNGNPRSARESEDNRGGKYREMVATTVFVL
jgi:hypothetical protein